MTPRPKFPNYANQLLKELELATGPLAHEDVVWLYQLGKLVETPPTGDPRQTGGFVTKAAGKSFSPINVHVNQWLNEYAIPWFEEKSGLLMELSMLFAADVCRQEPSPLISLTTEHETRQALLEWSAGLDCDDDQLSQIVAEVYPGEDPLALPVETHDKDGKPLPPEDPLDYDAAILEIILELGGTPDLWRVQESYSMFIKAIGQVCTQRARAAGRTNSDIEPAARAMKCFVYALADISKRREAAEAAKQEAQA